MGIFAFLTASRYKAELTRQREEIARLHKALDLEVAQKRDAERRAEQGAREAVGGAEECRQLREELAAAEERLGGHQAEWQLKLDDERRQLQAAAAKKTRGLEERVAALQAELEATQRQRDETAQQNAALTEQFAQLKKEQREIAATIKGSEALIAELEAKKRSLEGDLGRIMGNLNRW